MRGQPGYVTNIVAHFDVVLRASERLRWLLSFSFGMRVLLILRITIRGGGVDVDGSVFGSTVVYFTLGELLPCLAAAASMSWSTAQLPTERRQRELLEWYRGLKDGGDVPPLGDRAADMGVPLPALWRAKPAAFWERLFGRPPGLVYVNGSNLYPPVPPPVYHEQYAKLNCARAHAFFVAQWWPRRWRVVCAVR